MIQLLPDDLSDMCLYFLGWINELAEIKLISKKFNTFIKYEKHVTGIHKVDGYKGRYFRNLNILDCSGTELISLPRIKGLRKLNCSNNYILKLPIIEGLEILDCSNNSLVFIPKIESLIELNCSDNYIDKISFMKNLCNLTCLGNNLPYKTLKEYKLYYKNRLIKKS